MISDIILIGPLKAGKSTLAKLLSRRLKVPQYSLDKHRHYYKEAGFDEAYARELIRKDGFSALYHYRKPFEAFIVERILAQHSNCVFDFGACHSVYEDDALFERVRRILQPYRNVVLILPAPDLEESIQILRGRGSVTRIGEVDLCEHFVRHNSNFDLAKSIVYTKGKTPEITCNEILALLPPPAGCPGGDAGVGDAKSRNSFYGAPQRNNGEEVLTNLLSGSLPSGNKGVPGAKHPDPGNPPQLRHQPAS